MNNHDVAKGFEKMAELLELEGANPFKIRALQKGARVIEALESPLSDYEDGKALQSIDGIGKGLAEDILNMRRDGTFQALDDLKATYPETLFELFRVPGLGPKKIKVLYQDLDIKSLGELEYACEENRLLKLKGFGEKTQDRIMEGVRFLKQSKGQVLLAQAMHWANDLRTFLADIKRVECVDLAGSARRQKEVLKDLDFVVQTTRPTDVEAALQSYPNFKKTHVSGKSKLSFELKSGIMVDVRFSTPENHVSMVHHFTGSKNHHEKLRGLAKKKGFKLNEYGMESEKGPYHPSSEQDLYKKLDLHFIEPEMREGMDELDLAGKGKLPELICEGDLQGIFHVHSTYSDGKDSLEAMVQAAKALGYRYLGMSDHSQSAFYAHGLKEDDIKRQHEEIDALSQAHPDIKIFKGIESDILSDGALDYPDHVLDGFDFVIGSVHGILNMSEDDMTKRCLRAIEHPKCIMLGHPTGRLLLGRKPFAIRLEEVLQRSIELGKVVELNANPHRLDADWRVLRKLRGPRLQVSINPDAHSVDGLKDARFGIAMARKAGLSKASVFNTKSLDEMTSFLRAQGG